MRADTPRVSPSEIQYLNSFAAWERRPLHTLPRRAARRLAIRLGYEHLRVSGKLEEGLSVPRVQFYCLHHLFRDEAVPFRKLLRRLSKYFKFAAWSEGVSMVLEGRTPDQPVACFSSDDGYESNLRLGRVLREFGISGCFFVNPVSLLPQSDRWNERFCRTRLQARPTRFLNQRDVESLLDGGHEIGNHTLTHVVCSETPLARLSAEISEARHWLEARFGPILHFAWPYGQVHHFSDVARTLVSETGHVSAAGVMRGAHLLKTPGLAAADEQHSRRLLRPDGPDLAILRRDQIWAADPIEETLFFSARNGLGLAGPIPKLGGQAEPGTSGLSRWDEIAWRDGAEPAAESISGPDRANSPGRPAQYAPSPRTAARNVRNRTARSSQTDQFRT